jgi:excisionase family DNA binding protein
MRKPFFQPVSRRSLKTASRLEASKASTFGASGEAGLPSWVRQHEVRVSNKNNPDFGARQQPNGSVLNCTKGPPSQTIKLLTVAEAAWRLSLSEKTIRRMIEAGNLAVVRIGRSIRVHPEVIEKIMRQNE